MAQNQNKQNNEKGIFLFLILLCHIKREARNFKAVLLKMAFACMGYFWKFPHDMSLLFCYLSPTPLFFGLFRGIGNKNFKGVEFCPCIANFIGSRIRIYSNQTRGTGGVTYYRIKNNILNWYENLVVLLQMLALFFKYFD